MFFANFFNFFKNFFIGTKNSCFCDFLAKILLCDGHKAYHRFALKTVFRINDKNMSSSEPIHHRLLKVYFYNAIRQLGQLIIHRTFLLPCRTLFNFNRFVASVVIRIGSIGSNITVLYNFKFSERAKVGL